MNDHQHHDHSGHAGHTDHAGHAAAPAAAGGEELRDIADVAAVEIITSACVHLLSAAAVKVGPVAARYEGVARFTQRDDDKHHAVIRAEGRDVGGQGNAAATIDIQLREQGSGRSCAASAAAAAAWCR